jgi:MATH domain/Ankyrin repeats (many copies)
MEKDEPRRSSSLDEDEPDSSSQDPVHLEERLVRSSEQQLVAEDTIWEEKKHEDKLIKVIDDDEGADHAEPPAIPWKPQNVQSTCEFTHTISDYAQKRESGCKKAEYSATTVDEFGNRWRLIVYVNGNGRASNHHLSLFLQVADAEELPFGWKKAVSYVLTLEHPVSTAFSYAKRNPDKTFKLCPKAIDWGWSQFITSDRIQQERFISNDSLTVRASVTVKTSSVSIDEEDSELYLKCAVEEGDAEAVKLCLEQGASVNCKFKDDLYTPLHTACSSGANNGSMEVLNLLLEKGADGNACNKWRETPLLIAANNGHRTAVEALLKHGADPSLCSEAGWSALTFAAHKVCLFYCMIG